MARIILAFARVFSHSVPSPSGPTHLFLETNVGSVSQAQPEISAARNVLAEGPSGTTSVLLTQVCQIWKRKKKQKSHVVKS